MAFIVVLCRDPGSTPWVTNSLAICCSIDSGTPLNRRSSCFCIWRQWAQLVDQVIRPSLDAGRVVIADLFCLPTLSRRAMPSVGSGQIGQVGQVALDGWMPDCVFGARYDIEKRKPSVNRRLIGWKGQCDDIPKAPHASVFGRRLGRRSGAFD